MSKLRVNQLETLDGLTTVDVSTLVDDIDQSLVTTSTGEQALSEALDSRVIYVSTIAERDSLTGLSAGQRVSIQGAEFQWNGASWMNNSDFWSPEMYSNLVTGDDWADALQASATAAAGVTWRLSQEYKTSKQVSVPNNVHIESTPGASINGELITLAANAPDDCVVLFGGQALTALPALSGTANRGQTSVSFASAHGLVEGDVFCFYNPTDASYSSHRPVYRQGQWSRVVDVVSTTQVTVESPLYENYAAASYDMYKGDFYSYSFSGKFKASCIGSGTTLSAVKMFRCKDVDTSGVNATCKDNYAAISLRECFNIMGTGVTGVQNGLSGTGTDYGLAIANCQHLDITGYFSAARHGVTHGGFTGAGAVPNRDCKIRGTVTTTGEGNVQAADWHGNSEYCLFDGNIIGGITPGGRLNTCRGTIVADNRGIAVLFSEVAGFDFDFSGVYIKGTVDPLSTASRGLIDFGGAAVSDAADTQSGIIDFSGAVADAANATRIVNMRLRNNGSSGAQASFENFKIKQAGSGTLFFMDNIAAPEQWNQVYLEGFKMFGAGTFSISNVSLVYGRVSGKASVTITSGTSGGSASVTFPFSFGTTPDIQVAHEGSFVGTLLPIASLSSPSATGFTAQLRSSDNTNFGSTLVRSVHWTANLSPS